jgi:hypothetical protein
MQQLSILTYTLVDDERSGFSANVRRIRNWHFMRGNYFRIKSRVFTHEDFIMFKRALLVGRLKYKLYFMALFDWLTAYYRSLQLQQQIYFYAELLSASFIEQFIK